MWPPFVVKCLCAPGACQFAPGPLTHAAREQRARNDSVLVTEGPHLAILADEMCGRILNMKWMVGSLTSCWNSWLAIAAAAPTGHRRLVARSSSLFHWGLVSSSELLLLDCRTEGSGQSRAIRRVDRPRVRCHRSPRGLALTPI